jgi:hypothetical protein
MFFMNRDKNQVIGEIKPCQSPSQKPAIFPFASGVFARLFGPATQPATKLAIRNKIKNMAIALIDITTPPKEIIKDLCRFEH